MTNEPMTNEKEVELRVALAIAQKDAAEARAEAKELRSWLQAIEERSGLMSDSIFTRAFTVWGYYLLASLSMSLPVVVIILVVIELMKR